jgi:hypothetical protein
MSHILDVIEANAHLVDSSANASEAMDHSPSISLPPQQISITNALNNNNNNNINDLLTINQEPTCQLTPIMTSSVDITPTAADKPSQPQHDLSMSTEEDSDIEVLAITAATPSSSKLSASDSIAHLNKISELSNESSAKDMSKNEEGQDEEDSSGSELIVTANSVEAFSLTESLPTSIQNNPDRSQNDSSLIISNYDLLLGDSPPKHYHSQTAPAAAAQNDLSNSLNRVELTADECFVTVSSRGNGDNNNTASQSNNNDPSETAEAASSSGKPFFASKLTNSQMSEELSQELGL